MEILWFVLALIGLLLLLAHSPAGSAMPWLNSKRWPPIDDDEFLRRCRPGTDRETALRVRRIVSEQLGVPYEQIYPEQNFVKDLGCD